MEKFWLFCDLHKDSHTIKCWETFSWFAFLCPLPVCISPSSCGGEIISEHCLISNSLWCSWYQVQVRTILLFFINLFWWYYPPLHNVFSLTEACIRIFSRPEKLPKDLTWNMRSSATSGLNIPGQLAPHGQRLHHVQAAHQNSIISY